MTQRSLRRRKGNGAVLLIAVLLGCGVTWRACAQSAQPSLGTASVSPKQLATQAIENEVSLINYDRSYLRYRVHTKDAKGDQVRDVIETKDGSISRVVMRDDRPVFGDQDTEERQRLQEMLDSPRAFEKHIDKDKAGKKLAIDLIRLMPEAMLFQYAPGQPQREGSGATQEIVIDFAPNPEWKPPTMASQALTGIKGRCWIDPKTHFLVKLEAEVVQGINFGWGIFAHIYPGGKLTMEQAPVGSSRWLVDRFTGHLTVREMMVRTVKQDTDLYASDFTQIPEMGYKDAIKLLLNTPLPGVQAAIRH